MKERVNISFMKERVNILLIFLQSSEAILEGQLVTRMCCFQLLEVLYSRCSKDEVVGTGSTIVRTFTGGKVETGKELTVFISK